VQPKNSIYEEIGMKIEQINKPLSEIRADCEVVFVLNHNYHHKWITDQEELTQMHGFKGEMDECIFLPHRQKLYIALENPTHDDFRQAAAQALKIIKQSVFVSLKVGLYLGDECVYQNTKAIMEGFVLGDYAFERFKSKKNRGVIENIYLSIETYEGSIPPADLNEVIQNSVRVAQSVNFTRDIINTPPEQGTPVELAKIAVQLAKQNGLECKVLNEKQIAHLGMGAFLAVSRASVRKPRLIHLTHMPERSKGVIVVVGKGLTYDSGGLSLKPSESMLSMKSDKSGGCAVLGILKAVSALNLPYTVHGVIGATENMIGGNAYKPDDVLVAKNGKTIEVKNTDAEGRLVLADCLCYAQDLDPDYIIDIATLTGACVVALGEYTSGIMGHHSKLKQSMLEAAVLSGEFAAELPFNRHLEKLIKSEIADLSNIGNSRYGGAITAGLFLSEFIEEKNKDKWLHIDIAGPAFVKKEWGYNPFGASGAGVRMITTWIEQLSCTSKTSPCIHKD
jgi:leucyl aminopeptidase